MLLKLIEDLHTVTSAWVKSGQHLSPRFVIFSGVRKGCVLPPDLICAAIDFIMEHVSHKCGISVGTVTHGSRILTMPMMLCFLQNGKKLGYTFCGQRQRCS